MNGKAEKGEADRIDEAGRKGAVPISTNMAGRGTDILLGGNPEVLAKNAIGAEPTPPTPLDGEPPDLTAYQQALAEHGRRYQTELENFRQQTSSERAEVVAKGGLYIL